MSGVQVVEDYAVSLSWILQNSYLTFDGDILILGGERMHFSDMIGDLSVSVSVVEDYSVSIGEI